MDRTVQGRAGAVVILGIAIAVAVFAWNASLTWATVVDDAYISARYAEHLAEGHGLVYSADEPPVEGYTNLLWTILLGLGRVVGLPILGLMTGLGFLFGLVTIAATVGIARRLDDPLAERPLHPLVIAPALVLALSPHLAVSSTNGIESTMMSAMVCATLWAHLAVQRRRWLVGLLAAALVLTRPEGVAIAGLIALHDLWRHRRAPGAALPHVGILAVAVIALFAWRIATYGELLPNTWAAKSSFGLTETFRINRNYFTENRAPLIALALLWAGQALLPPWRTDKQLVSVVALVLGVVPLTVNLWMPGLRLFLPTGALVAALYAAALLRAPRPLGWAGAVAAVVGMAVYLGVGGDKVRAYDGRHSVLPGNGTEIAARHLAAHAPEGAWLATRDAGCFAYWVGTQVKVAELHQRALTQPHPGGANAEIRAFTPNNPAFFVGTLQRRDAPEFAYGNDRAIFRRLTMPYVYLGRVEQHYHRFYDVYARADLDVPPLPEAALVGKQGPKPPVEAKPGEAQALAEPLPDTGL